MRLSILPLSLFALAGCDGASPDLPDASIVADAVADAVAADAALDAPNALDLSCLGSPPLANTGPQTIGGKVFSIENYEITPVLGAQIEFRIGGTVIDSATTQADGGFVLDEPGPTHGVFVVTSQGHVPTYAFERDLSWSGDAGMMLLVASSAEIGRWYADAGAPPVAGARTILSTARDCGFATGDGTAIAVAPAPSAIAYYDTVAKRWDPALAASTNGFALTTSAAASVTITARLGGTAFPPETVAAVPDALTLLLVSPYN